MKKRLTVAEIREQSMNKLAKILRRERELLDANPTMNAGEARRRAEDEIGKEMRDKEHPELKGALRIRIDSQGNPHAIETLDSGVIRAPGAAAEYLKQHAAQRGQPVTLSVNEACIALHEKSTRGKK